MPTNNGVQELEGKLFQNKEEVAAFWKAFWRKYKPDPQAKIRRPTAKELDLYWAMIPYDITEPIFMIESKEATILAHFPDKKMKLGWIDDYKDVHFKAKGERRRPAPRYFHHKNKIPDVGTNRPAQSHE